MEVAKSTASGPPGQLYLWASSSQGGDVAGRVGDITVAWAHRGTRRRRSGEGGSREAMERTLGQTQQRVLQAPTAYGSDADCIAGQRW